MLLSGLVRGAAETGSAVAVSVSYSVSLGVGLVTRVQSLIYGLLRKPDS